MDASLFSYLRQHPFIHLSEEEVRVSAYYHYLNKSNGEDNDPVLDWLLAEQQMLLQHLSGLVSYSDLYPGNMFFSELYEPLAVYTFRVDSPGYHKPIGTKEPRVCSLCQREEGVVNFRKDAHVIPELFGNKWLITYDECDECNGKYGKLYENDLGHFTHPQRVISRIHTKETTAKIKRSSTSKSYVGGQNRGTPLMIGIFSDDPSIQMEFNGDGTATLTIPSPSFRPLYAAKSIAKSVWQVIPNELRYKFDQLRTWLINPDSYVPTELHQFFIPGPGLNRVGIAVWSARDEFRDIPQLVSLVYFGNTILVWPLPWFSGEPVDPKIIIPDLPLSAYPPHTPQGVEYKILSNDKARVKPTIFTMKYSMKYLTFEEKPIAVEITAYNEDVITEFNSILTTQPDPHYQGIGYDITGEDLHGVISVKADDSNSKAMLAYTEPNGTPGKAPRERDIISALQGGVSVLIVNRDTDEIICHLPGVNFQVKT
ncbi:MAG: HNH endonuclease [Armatimonadota bacterium]